MMITDIRQMTNDMPGMDVIVGTWLTIEDTRTVMLENPANVGKTISYQGVRDLCYRGVLRSKQVGGRLWFVDPESAKAYIIQGRGPKSQRREEPEDAE